MKYVKPLSGVFLAGTMAVTLVFGVTTLRAEAEEATTVSVTDLSALLERIEELQEQVRALQEQQKALRGEIREAVALTRTLTAGMSGEDVEALQELLASDPDIYPEGLVTGYFGSLTEEAVKKLQERFGIEQVGTVGPLTRGTINKLFKHYKKDLRNAFEKVLVDEDDLDDEDVDLSEYTPGTTGILVCHAPGGNTSKAHTIAIGGPAVQAHLAHGDTLGGCDGETEADDKDEDESDEEDDTTVSEAEEAIEDAEEAIADATEAIEEAEDDDLDTEDAEELLAEAEELLEDAEEALEDEVYEEAVELANEAEETAEDAEDAIEDDESEA